MKYISLFSGIGGFEVAIHKKWLDAECLGYSEIDEDAIKVYKFHFPTHNNLGDIRYITENNIINIIKNGCDLVFGGFPCKNLSSLSVIYNNNKGLEGKQSSLFYYMINIIEIVLKYNPSCKFIFENNFSMSNKNKELITTIIRNKLNIDIFKTVLDSADFGVQKRKRIFWTNFYINTFINKECKQTWKDVLEPLDKVQSNILSENYIQCLNKCINTKSIKKYKVEIIPCNNSFTFKKIEHGKKSWSRIQASFHSDNTDGSHDLPYSYPIGKSRLITCSFGNHNILIDRRIKNNNLFIPRLFTFIEIERLFGLKDNYTEIIKSKNKRKVLLGNTVVIPVIEYILKNI